MNIYILSATKLAYTPNLFLTKSIPIKGIIGLNNESYFSNKSEYFSYEKFCKSHNIDYIPLISYDFKNNDDQKILESLNIDILVVTSWQRLIPQWLIDQCKIGIIGSHGSPEGISLGRGRSPQNWALIFGCPQFELSIFWIDKGIDSGDIIDTRNIVYEITDDILTSYLKTGLALSEMVINAFRNGAILKKHGVPQIENAGKYLPQRIYEDGMIDWTRSNEEIYNFIRALSKPYPGSFTRYKKNDIIIWRARPINNTTFDFSNYSVGEVIAILPDAELLVKCGSGLLMVMEYCSDINITEHTILETADFKEQINTIVKRHTSKCSLPLSTLITNAMTIEEE